jgi:ABC-type proline/glycine betaine transport system permease subunit
MMLAFLGIVGDSVDFIFHSRESVGGGAQIGGSELLPLIGKHLEVTLEAMAIACIVGIPPALWIGHLRRGQLVASTIANAGRALPSFAVVVFTSSFALFGLSTRNLVFAMVLLAVPPIFTNTYVGIRQVDADIVDAARGMGMSRGEIVRGVEVPIATPVIFAGIRTAAVQVVSGAVLAAYIGGGGLGDFITAGIAMMALPQLFVGAIPATLLSIGTDQLFGYLQKTLTPRGLRPA